MSAPAVLVVTGSTGSGKSTVSRWLAERGAYVIDADRVGHEILLRPEVLAAVAERFGADVLDPRGQIDRAVLGPRVFATPEDTRALNRIVHPPLVAEVARRIQVAQTSRAAPLIVVDAALHFEFDPPLPADAVVMTVADREVREARIRDRDGLSAEAAAARMARQVHLEGFADAADAVLDTGRSRDAVRAELLKRVDALLGLHLTESDPPRAEETGD